MKIAFIVDNFPCLSQTFVLNQITGLIERGHEVDIYARIPKTQPKIHPDVEKYNLLERTFYQEIPNNYCLRLLKGIGLLVANFYKNPKIVLRSLNIIKYGRQAASLRWLYKIIPHLDRREYEIIHCQFGTCGLRALSFRNFGILQGKMITTFRGSDISKYVREHGDRVYEQLFAEGDLFLGNCEFFRQRAIELGCDQQKIIVHGSGIDCNKFAFSPRYFPADGRVRVATIGRLVEKKGIEYSIRAIAILARVYENIEYNIIGDGILMESFRQLIRGLDLDRIVKLLGAKQHQEVIEILDKSHIFIAPSVRAANGDCDAPVNTLKEAMAMGLPVISTHHGGIPELVEDGISGFLVPERDANAIAEKIHYLIEHPERWVEMGKAGRSRVEEKYDMNKLNDELVNIYQQLLDSKLPRSQSSTGLVAFNQY
jgi:colanic acid/amylovoran biosynthesis glycosyltransferase